MIESLIFGFWFIFVIFTLAMDLVSIIIPTFNRKSSLKRAIQSALKQKKVPFEIIVIDDGSTDGTDKMVRESFPMAQYIKQKK